jgi:hypothetical protein
MRRGVTAIIVLVAFVAPAPLAAQAPDLRGAIASAASPPAPQTPPPAARRNPYFWPGVVLIAGGATLAILATTGAKKETCGVVSNGFEVAAACVQETNKPLLWIGIGAAAGGATLLAVGGRHHQIAVGPTSVKYRIRF